MTDDKLLEAREHLLHVMRAELLGPGSEASHPGDDVESEIITSLPEVRYSVGILFPQGNRVGTDNDEAKTVESVDDEDSYDQSLAENHTDVAKDSEIDTVSDVKYADNSTDGTDVGTIDEDIGLAAQSLPSSMGLTFFVREDIRELVVGIEYGTYRKAQLADCQLRLRAEDGEPRIPQESSSYVQYDPGTRLLTLKAPLKRAYVHSEDKAGRLEDTNLRDCLYRLCDQYKRGFVREPHSLKMTVTLDSCGYTKKSVRSNPSLQLTCIKKPVENGLKAITVMLVNMEHGKYQGTNSVFQPVLRVDARDNEFSFVEYSLSSFGSAYDDEESGLALLYRNKGVYATGHGTSVDWSIDAFGKGALWTEFLPIAQVAQMDFETGDQSIPPNAFSMKYLSDLDNSGDNEKLATLSRIVASYGDWIDRLEARTEHLEAHHRSVSARHMGLCRECAARMSEGIEVLRTNSNALAAFFLANRAMYMQRIHTGIQAVDSYPSDTQLREKMTSLDYRRAEEYHPNGKIPTWRPFQLAFLLMSLRSIVEPDSHDRDLVDLIWFPTGGGKTEAYLGLTAFTIFYRRLAHADSASGTTVIMRYTLRLLASQQFARASILICACEAIRRDCENAGKYPSYPLGDDSITIGLWIGGSHTPNRTTGDGGAQYHQRKLCGATARGLREAKDKHNKFQILKCPWCGTKMEREIDASGNRLVGQWGYRFRHSHFYLCCTQEGCLFEKSLPIQVVDEELYAQPPTLLFGTVDKFAMIAWKEDPGSFFGCRTRNRAPELIIQDELHLISGPLGTMVGLYEAAIDALCSSKGIRPKIIASTATIRRAKTQCSALYNREVRQFPPPGLDASDSYFAREADSNQKPGRKYMGIMPAGKTKAMMEVRTIAAILQHVQMMSFDDDVKDKYWTLAAYFNSLRDLGKCATLVSDDVKDAIRRIVYRFGRGVSKRPIGWTSELTSRVSTTQLNETLHRL
ncbi:MAG: helicase, partial [Bacillota bacterium]